MRRKLERKSRRSREKNAYSIHLQRLREIEQVISARYGRFVPETDDSDVFVEAAVYALNAHAKAVGLSDLDRMIDGWCSRWAPWVLPRAGDIIRLILNKLDRRRHDIGADQVAQLLRVSYAERQALNLRTIGACDMSRNARRSAARQRKRDMDRIRQQEKRRAAGSIPRKSWLEKNSITRAKPWEALGISRRTWYRRGVGTDTSRVGIIPTVTGDGLVPSGAGWPVAAPDALTGPLGRPDGLGGSRPPCVVQAETLQDGPHGPEPRSRSAKKALSQKDQEPVRLGAAAQTLLDRLRSQPFLQSQFDADIANGDTEPLGVNEGRIRMGGSR